MSSDSSVVEPGADVRSTTLTRDLITVGVFTALYFVVMAVVGQVGSLIPIGQVLGPLYIPIICGIPFMLFLTRVQRFGLIFAMGVIIGILFPVTGQSWVATVLGVVLGLLADLIARAGGYRRWINLVLAYVVFAIMGIGMVVPLFFQRAATIAKLQQHQSSAWVEQVERLTPPWLFYVMILMLAVGAVIGAYLGRAVFRKHFAYLAPSQPDARLTPSQPDARLTPSQPDEPRPGQH
jgi:energy-coupling factor transport system substrate-specific component